MTATTKIDWEPGSFEITTGEGFETRTGTVSSDCIWGIDQRDAGFVLTHLPSKRRCNKTYINFAYEQTAMTFAERLSQIADFTAMDGEKARATLGLRRKAAHICLDLKLDEEGME